MDGNNQGITFDSTPQPESQSKDMQGVTFDKAPTPSAQPKTPAAFTVPSVGLGEKKEVIAPAPSYTGPAQAPAAEPPSPKAGLDLGTAQAAAIGGATGIGRLVKGAFEMPAQALAYEIAGQPQENVEKQMEAEDEALKHQVYADFREKFHKGQYGDALASLSHLFTDAPQDPNDPVYQFIDQSFQNAKQSKEMAMDSAKKGDFAGVMQHSVGAGVGWILPIDQAMENFRQNPTRANLKEVVANAIPAFIPSLIRGTGKVGGMVKEAAAERVAPVTTETAGGARIPTLPDTGVAGVVAKAAPEAAEKFAQTRTAPEVSRAIGGTVGEATGSEAATTLTPKDRFGMNAHGEDLQGQAQPAFRRVDELSGNKLTEAQNQIRKGWATKDMDLVDKGEAAKSDLYNKYRDQLKSEGLDIDTAESNWRKGVAAIDFAKKLRQATGVSDVEGADWTTKGRVLRNVIDAATQIDKHGTSLFDRMGLTEEHIQELRDLSKILDDQQQMSKAKPFMRGLAKMATFAIGMHGGIPGVIEAVTGTSAAEHLVNHISTRVMEDAMSNYDAARALNDGIRTGDAQPVINALEKDPTWFERGKQWMSDLYNWYRSKGETGAVGAKVTQKRAGVTPEGKVGVPVEAEQKRFSEAAPSYGALADYHNLNKGFTYNMGEGFMRDQPRFSVAGEHTEFDKVFDKHNLSAQDLHDYMENPELKKLLQSDPSLSVGGWMYKGKSHLEVSRLFKEREAAVAAGKRLNQESVYDHAAHDSISTGGTAADIAQEKAGVAPAPVTEANISAPGAEGAASLEAIRRESGRKAAGLRVYDVDTRMGSSKVAWNPLFGVDIADRTPSPGHVIVEVDKDGNITQTLSEGRGARPLPPAERIQSLVGQAAPETPVAARPEVAAEAARQGLAQHEVSTRAGDISADRTTDMSLVNEADSNAPARTSKEGNPILGIKQKMAAKISKYPGMAAEPEEILNNPDGVIQRFTDHIKDNLKFLYNTMPEEYRNLSQKWYEGAHGLSKNWANEFGFSHRQTAGAIATLSPNNGWENNISLARRMMDTLRNKADVKMTPEMESNLPELKKQFDYGTKRWLEDIRGKSLNEINDADPDVRAVKKALWIRLFDEAHNEATNYAYSPDGTRLGPAEGKAGTRSWIGNQFLARAVRMLEDDSVQTVHDNLGSGHKVRNFYNNIINPWSEHGHVTIDTHAVGAGLLSPLSGDDVPPAENFGRLSEKKSGLKGMYPVYAEAYKQAAAELGIRPRELQSSTWEAIRSLIDQSQKRDKAFRGHISDIWEDYRNGHIDRAEAQRRFLDKTGGFKKPSWATDEQWEKMGGTPAAVPEEDQTAFKFGGGQ